MEMMMTNSITEKVGFDLKFEGYSREWWKKRVGLNFKRIRRAYKKEGYYPLEAWKVYYTSDSSYKGSIARCCTLEEPSLHFNMLKIHMHWYFRACHINRNNYVGVLGPLTLSNSLREFIDWVILHEMCHAIRHEECKRLRTSPVSDAYEELKVFMMSQKILRKRFSLEKFLQALDNYSGLDKTNPYFQMVKGL